MSVEEYRHYHRHGYLKVERLVPRGDIRRLLEWAESHRQPVAEMKQSETGRPAYAHR